jgi:hypothetical protein
MASADHSCRFPDIVAPSATKDPEMTKLETLKAAAARDDWREAIAIAARFPQLGKIRGAVLDAHMAFTNPRFLQQVKRDPQACIAAGRAALIEAYKLDRPAR